MSLKQNQPPIPQQYQNEQQPILQQVGSNQGQSAPYQQNPQNVSNTYYQNPQYQEGSYRVASQSPGRYQNQPQQGTSVTQYQPVNSNTYYNPQRSAQSPGRNYEFSPKRYPTNPGKPSYSGKNVYPVKGEPLSIWDWCKYLIPLLFAIFALITCIFLLCSHTDMTPNEEAAKQVLLKARKNLESVPFTDFEVVESSVPCDEGYEEISIGEWPGTETGCICQDEEDGSHSIHHITYCGLHPIKCETVFSNDPVKIQNFKKNNGKGQNKQYHICADRADLPLKVSESCTNETYDEKAGPELCSPDEVLSKASYVSDQATFDKLTGISTLDLQEAGGWKFEKDENVLPLVDFELVPSKKGNVVSCWRNDQQGATDSGKWYELSTKTQQGCIQNPGEIKEADRDDLTAEQIIIDEKVKGQFEEQRGGKQGASDLNSNNNNFVDLGLAQPLLETYKNNIPTDDLEDLEYFDNNYDNNDQLHLIMKRRLYVNGQNEICKNIDTEHLTWIEEDANTLKAISTSWAIIIIIIAITIILIFVVFLALSKLYSPFAYRFIWILFAIGVVLGLIFGIIWFVYKHRPNGLQNLQERYQEYATDDCFDQNSRPVGLAAESVSGYAKATIDNQEHESLWLFWGCVAFAILGILFIIFLIATGKGF